MIRFLACSLVVAVTASAEIVQPDDAPQPLSPGESAKRVSLPDGFRLELLAAEPLVRQPTGVCWDARGRLFVCELHGYNLEGQYDVEELNKTGELDRVVRRISAPPEAVARAERDQHGVVKRLIDSDGDGRMDRAETWADDLPPCLGIVPAEDGVIVAAAPDIIFLADRDGDGRAEIRETRYTGFGLGPLERRINQPRWGMDGWIYLGRGKRCRITGPRLPEPVELPSTDFRIRADGSAIEAISGGTHSIGFTFTAEGHRFVATTSSPGHFVAPLPWTALARNPNLVTGKLQQPATDYKRCYPRARPHPWRTRRAEDPGFSAFYRKRYGASESDASGWFTSGCSPLVVRDDLPHGLKGHYLACEPAGNLVHRALPEADGPALKLRRLESEQESEFLASEDIWFHPVSLSHAPDGAIVIVDFYREIIEDYSAIPRYLQQQYQLHHGKDHGRLWRLVHRDLPAPPPPDLSTMNTEALARALASPYHWRRQTARRLLAGKLSPEAIAVLETQVRDPSVETALHSLHALAETHALRDTTLRAGLDHPAPGVRMHALRLAEQRLGRSRALTAKVLTMTDDASPSVLLQLALSLGALSSDEAITALAELGSRPIQWMDLAVLSSVHGREPALLVAMGDEPPAWMRRRQAGRKPESEAQRRARVSEAIRILGDVAQAGPERLKAARELATAEGAEPTASLVGAFAAATPALRAVILEALFRRPERYVLLCEALEQKNVPAASLNAIQRKRLLEHPDERIRLRAQRLLQPDEQAHSVRVEPFLKALATPGDSRRGETLFRTHCAACHRVGKIGTELGPDLSGETRRAEQTLIKDIVFPGSEIAVGYETYLIKIRNGIDYAGLLISESPGILVLRDASGQTHPIPRKDIASIEALDVSLMPEGLADLLKPRGVADVLAWLRQSR